MNNKLERIAKEAAVVIADTISEFVDYGCRAV
jgi:hypothetical protein